jgi:hypothetical protein
MSWLQNNLVSCLRSSCYPGCLCFKRCSGIAVSESRRLGRRMACRYFLSLHEACAFSWPVLGTAAAYTCCLLCCLPGCCRYIERQCHQHACKLSEVLLSILCRSLSELLLSILCRSLSELLLSILRRCTSLQCTVRSQAECALHAWQAFGLLQHSSHGFIALAGPLYVMASLLHDCLGLSDSTLASESSTT